ncbi:hypothetical protein A3A60_01450 [Candidatus Curtissbacteria bacterium RIFCSPLOWO2_01_FULL_42_26]|uniref:DUF2933 domain-containing protein n=1 Tax=Candidatus Curtissbacteria bacterium RIFCSPLOWO2_01_FULL_42_26 TaxID=1797729 RepID=A0A1F5HZI0_9BACT|nr:MAG: hypothetical protein A3A60_01450 [Candidatus Curtissbacteria bacterium RIFCSPLOWO2_01_FULL_42_26]
MNKLSRHKLIIIAGCLAPILVFTFFLIFRFGNNSLIYLLILLCPLGHFFLMRDHGNKHIK